MPSQSVIICSKDLDATDLNLARLLDFFGVGYRIIHLNNCVFEPDCLAERLGSDDPCVFMSCKAIAASLQNSRDCNALRAFLCNNVSHMLVYNISPTDLEISAINCLTDGTIKSLSHFNNGDYQYKVSKDLGEICRQFSGLAFGPINNKTDFKFSKTNESAGVSNLVAIDGHPFFVRMNIGKCDAFLVANNRILDINKKTTRMIKTEELFSQIVPEMMFIKYVFNDKCWHNSTSHASLTVDDPLLRQRYGFLDYRRLLEEMDKHEFSASIAFIPWNFRRTSSEVAGLFRERPDRFTICVHGCDHTQNEFGTRDMKELNSKIELATTRMNHHERVAGLRYDKVMVFPQGKFSTSSMRMLKSNNYVAAVNTGAIPVDESEGLEVSHFLEPAVMKYESFPLFLRRCPVGCLDFAFDLFLGRPALAVVHHDCFREGYHRIATFIDRMNSLDKNIRWVGLESIIERSYLQRREDDNTINVRMFAKRAVISNTCDHVMKYIITKCETGNVPIEGIVINGKGVSCEVENQLLNLSLEIEPKQSAIVEITYRNDYPYSEERYKIGRGLKVSLRRHLSEIRDHYISRNELLLSIAQRMFRES